MATKKPRPPRPSRRHGASEMTPGVSKSIAGNDKLIKKLREDLRKHKDFIKEARKKLTVHQDPKSKMSAEFRSMMDQPRKKKVRSPHADKKNERKMDPKYRNIFKKAKGPKGKA